MRALSWSRDQRTPAHTDHSVCSEQLDYTALVLVTDIHFHFIYSQM